jgi:LuxR family maltose regulon positive regulatory protein
LLAQMRGRFGDAAQHTEHVLSTAAQSPPLWLSQLHAAHISGLTELSLGRLSGALRQFEMPERALIGAQRQSELGVNPSQLLALLSGAKALALYEMNRLDDAQDCLERYAPFLSCIFSPSSRMLWHQVSARLYALRGDEDACLTALEEGNAYAIRHGVGWMEVLMRWARVDVDIARGDLNHARSIATSLLERVPLNVAPEWITPCEEIFGPIISAMRFLIHTDQSRLALSHLPLHIAHAELQLRRLQLTKLRVLEALALATIGERQQALAALRVAIGLGQQSGAIRTFVDEGCLELLRELERGRPLDPDTGVYMRRLLAAYAGAEELDAHPSGRVSPESQAAALSVREKQILQHLAQGHSNLAMGQRLFLSPNTVKWHLSQLYSKLGVHNRTGAVHVARQQNILQ